MNILGFSKPTNDWIDYDAVEIHPMNDDDNHIDGNEPIAYYMVALHIPGEGIEGVADIVSHIKAKRVAAAFETLIYTAREQAELSGGGSMNTVTVNGFKHQIDMIKRMSADLEEHLWEVQLKHYPDSVRVSRQDALKWLDWYDPGVLQRAASYWDEHDGILYRDDRERRIERARYLGQYVERKKLQIARALAFCIQDRVGIFYTCCDGRYKGFRFGLDGSEYLSNFSD